MRSNERREEPFDVCVGAKPAPAADRHGIYRTDLRRERINLVDVRHQPDLERRRDARAAQPHLARANATKSADVTRLERQVRQRSSPAPQSRHCA